MFQKIISQYDNKFASKHLRKNKQKNERWEEKHRRKKPILLESMQRLK